MTEDAVLRRAARYAQSGAEGLPALRRALARDFADTTKIIGARIGGRDIAGEALARALRGCGTAALICATLGQAADRLLARAQVQDMAWALMLDACASALVEEAAAPPLRGAAEAAGHCRGAAHAPPAAVWQQPRGPAQPAPRHNRLRFLTCSSSLGRAPSKHSIP